MHNKPLCVPTHGLYVTVSKYVALRRIGQEWAGKSPFVGAAPKEDRKSVSLFVNNEKGVFWDTASGRNGAEADFLRAVSECGVVPLPSAPATSPVKLKLVQMVLNDAHAPPASLDARRAAIMGSRAFISEERFDALLRLLIHTKVVNPLNAAAACEELSARFSLAARGELRTGYETSPGELKHAAAHAASLAMEFSQP